MRRCRPKHTSFCAHLARSGLFRLPPQRSITQTTMSMCSITAGAPISTGSVSKFNSSGNLVASFGKEGELDGREAEAGPFQEAFSAEYEVNYPTSLAVDNTCSVNGLERLACTRGSLQR